jgi:hypothetical protein
VAPIELPRDVKWVPNHPKTPRCTLEYEKASETVILRVTLGSIVDRVVVLGPDPDFVEILAKAGVPVGENGEAEYEFKIPRDEIPEEAGHLVVCSRSKKHGNYGAGQALFYR